MLFCLLCKQKDTYSIFRIGVKTKKGTGITTPMPCYLRSNQQLKQRIKVGMYDVV